MAMGQEVKIAPASDPRASSQARTWAQVQELFWGLGKSGSLEEGPPPSQAAVIPAQPTEEGKGGPREGRERGQERGGRRRCEQGCFF